VTDVELARSIHARFSKFEGSDHIASRFALEHLAALLTERKPRYVLELGAGIGTITELLLSHPAGITGLIATETQPFCLNALEKNLSNRADPRLRVVTTPQELAQHRRTVDLIVGDGSLKDPAETAFAGEGTSVFVEGNRSGLRARFDSELHKRGLALRLRHYGPPRLPYRLRLSRRFLIPLPVPARGKDGGCWIGEVTKSPSPS
jgi:hypothetical protein